MSRPVMRPEAARRLARQRFEQVEEARAMALQVLELVRVAADYCDREHADRLDDLCKQAHHLYTGLAWHSTDIRPPDPDECEHCGGSMAECEEEPAA